MKRSDILAYAQTLGYASIRRRGSWRGYEVYEPIMAGPGIPIIGLPQFILVSIDTIRMTDVDECFEVLHHLNSRQKE